MMTHHYLVKMIKIIRLSRQKNILESKEKHSQPIIDFSQYGTTSGQYVPTFLLFTINDNTNTHKRHPSKSRTSSICSTVLTVNIPKELGERHITVLNQEGLTVEMLTNQIMKRLERRTKKKEKIKLKNIYTIGLVIDNAPPIKLLPNQLVVHCFVPGSETNHLELIPDIPNDVNGTRKCLVCFYCAKIILGTPKKAINHYYHKSHFMCNGCGTKFHEDDNYKQPLDSQMKTLTSHGWQNPRQLQAKDLAFCNVCYHKMCNDFCANCESLIETAKNLVTIDNQTFHKSCVRCIRCGEDAYVKIGKRFYCKEHFQKYNNEIEEWEAKKKRS